MRNTSSRDSGICKCRISPSLSYFKIFLNFLRIAENSDITLLSHPQCVVKPVFGKGAENPLRSSKYLVLCRANTWGWNNLSIAWWIGDCRGRQWFLKRQFSRRVVQEVHWNNNYSISRSFWLFTFIVVRQSSSIADVSGRDSYRGRLVIEILKYPVSQ